MVRKAASEGPSLFCEWAVGSTINSAMRKLEKERLKKEQEEAQCKRDVIKVELTTDDESETDSVRVTYPRSGARARARGAAKASGPKQVRFEQGPLKPALKKKARKKRAYGSSESDTLGSEPESGTDTRSVDTSVRETSDSEATSTDTSTSRRRSSRKSRKPGQSKSASSEDSDTIYDSNCSDCERDLAKKKAKGRRSRRKYASDAESSTESENVRRSKKDEKRKRSKKERRSGSRKDYPVNVDSDSDTSDHGDKNSRRGKESKKHQPEGDLPKAEAHASSKVRKSASSSKEKTYPEAMPGPHPRRPNLIRPIRAEVMQVEHTVERPEDPRPNAFVDERNNVVRVYHGPAYGNPLGNLYPRRDPSLRRLPVGVPHPLHNPYYHGFRNSQHQNHPHIGHMPTTLGEPYSSIPANAPIHSGPGSGHGANDLTSGLWGLDSGSPNATKDKASSSWTNNVGPPQPSASLRKANPNSRWAYVGSKKGSRKDGGHGSVKDDWGKTSNNTWGDGGNIDNNVGWNDEKWGTKAGNDKDNRDAMGGGNDWNGGNAGESWNQGNGDTAGENNSWGAGDQGGSSWENNGNTGNAENNQSPGQPDGSWDNNMSWDNNVGHNNWNANNDSWENNNTNNGKNADWAKDNNSWNADSPNNVGPENPPQDTWSGDRVPGAWAGISPDGPYPDWRDPTAAQSTRVQKW